MSDGSKVCRKCGAVRQLSDFYRNKGALDGLSGRCKQCANSATREWDLKNPDRRREIDATRRAKKLLKDGPEKYRQYIRDKVAKWAAANPGKVSAKARERVLSLSDRYIARSHFGLPLEIIPTDLINLKRSQLQQKRLLKALNEALNEATKGESK
ncbi:MAG: hypothetical protein WA191_07225 [Telluria sp.]